MSGPRLSRGAARLRATTRSASHDLAGGLRALGAVVFGSMMLYLVFRIGVQITAGLAPAFVTNAWGGPTAVGALLAHTLDAIAAMIVCALLMYGVLLADG